MNHTRNGVTTHTHAHSNPIRSPESSRDHAPPQTISTPQTSPAQNLAPPDLCEACQHQVLFWLRQYERDLETQAKAKPGRNSYLTLGLAKHVTLHLRRLRRMLTRDHVSVIDLAKEIFDATEVNGAEINGTEVNGLESNGHEENGSCD